MSSLEITFDELKTLFPTQYLLVDVRNQDAIDYGMLPGAVWVAPTEFENGLSEERLQQFREAPRVVLYCTKGELSLRYAQQLQEQEIRAVSLAGGYVDYVLRDMEHSEAKRDEIEQSIRKTFHKKLFTPFAKAINRYELLQPGDHVAVCISGGKDSMLMAKLFQELKKHNKFDFELTFLVMDPGYSAANRQVIEQNAKMMDIPVTIFESQIFDTVDTIENSPCYICARMRRGYLYSKAKELGCNKIALGHHYDDVIETILMGMLYGAQVQTMMPKIHSTNFEGMELIRPMYLIREDDIKRWRDSLGLHFIQCACHFTDTCSAIDPEGHSHSKRMEVKHLIAEMKKTNPFVEGNIFKSVENVNLRTIIAYKENGVKHDFTENYESWGADGNDGE